MLGEVDWIFTNSGDKSSYIKYKKDSTYNEHLCTCLLIRYEATSQKTWLGKHLET